ncbi:MAG TPA: PH domain-containing protein [Acidobacteriaceae bacterium]|jgi:hypothetical protein|nr:PH domain-containing protein [Acidobacteriaceae bacterium]
MGYIERNLVPGERVVYKTRLHWIVMLGRLVLAILFLAGGVYLFYYAYQHQAMPPNQLHLWEGAGVACVAIALVVFVMGTVRRNATEMAVTNRRVVIKTGLASRRTIEMLLNKVETIEIAEPAMGRILGYGSIQLVGTGGTNEPFHRMAHPLEFRNAVQQEIEKLRPGDATAEKPLA